MMLKVLSSICLISVSLSYALHANAETAYKLLKNTYEDLRSPALETDFDRIGFPNGNICIEFRNDQPNDHRNINLHKYTIHHSERGPHLPARRQTKVIFGMHRGYNLIRKAEKVTNKVKRNDFVIHQNESEFFNFEVKVRRLQIEDITTLHFRRAGVEGQDSNQRPKRFETYGYCYKPDQETLVLDGR